MIVDYYAQQYVLFDGSHSYAPIVKTTEMPLLGRNIMSNKNLIDTFVCVIHFSSNFSHTIPGKKDMIRKECTSFLKNFPKMLVKTTKLLQKKDMYAIVRIEDYKNNMLLCEVISNGYLGEVNSKNCEVESKLMEYICTSHWKRSKKILEQFNNLQTIDLTPNRTILDKFTIYTIDPSNCRDIDDALHCTYDSKLKQYYLGIHIADVSSYIPEDHILNEELARRVETVYDYQKEPIHMIPEELSIQYISLLEGKNKRAFSILITLNEKFDIIDVEFKKTMIVVKKNMTYDEAQNMVKTDDNIKLLYDIGLKLRLDISNAFPEGEQYDTHQMVAVFMIYANKLVGEKIQSYDPINVLLRTHQSPKCDNKSDNKGDNDSSGSLPYTDTINTMLIKTNMTCGLERAKYGMGINNCSHFGLNLAFYTHMTSPIRRYADIIIHRQLWKAICGVPLLPQNIDELFVMNFYKNVFKLSERMMKNLDLASKIGDDCLEEDAYIVNISEDRDSVRLFIPNFDLTYDLRLINDNLRSIFKLTVEQDYDFKRDKMIVVNMQENTSVTYVLYQKVRVKIIKTLEAFVGIRIDLV
jgi:exosome complex exonuclease DIS3/RRP44